MTTETWPQPNNPLQAAWDKRTALHAESKDIHTKSVSLHYESYTFYTENKRYAEGAKLHAESVRLRAESDKLYAEGDLVWVNAVIAAYGPRCVLTWNYAIPATCTLEY